MQITISGQQVDVTDSLRSYASEKMGRLQRHFDHMTNTHVVLHVEKNRHKAEATVNLKGVTLHADATGDDMYAALDGLVDKLDRQLLKHKEKLIERHRGADSLKN